MKISGLLIGALLLLIVFALGLVALEFIKADMLLAAYIVTGIALVIGIAPTTYLYFSSNSDNKTKGEAQ